MNELVLHTKRDCALWVNIENSVVANLLKRRNSCVLNLNEYLYFVRFNNI